MVLRPNLCEKKVKWIFINYLTLDHRLEKILTFHVFGLLKIPCGKVWPSMFTQEMHLECNKLNKSRILTINIRHSRILNIYESFYYFLLKTFARVLQQSWLYYKMQLVWKNLYKLDVSHTKNEEVLYIDITTNV